MIKKKLPRSLAAPPELCYCIELRKKENLTIAPESLPSPPRVFFELHRAACTLSMLSRSASKN